MMRIMMVGLLRGVMKGGGEHNCSEPLKYADTLNGT